MIKPPAFLSFFPSFVFYFVCMYVFLLSFKPSGSKSDYQGFHVGGQEGTEGGVGWSRVQGR